MEIPVMTKELVERLDPSRNRFFTSRTAIGEREGKSDGCRG